MKQSQSPKDNENQYFMDHESGAEMARLLDQDQMCTEGMGGLFAERSDNLVGIQRVLDVACGPGGWAMEVARNYPDMEVVGFDISKAMIDYARATARVRRVNNVRFEIMDFLQPWQFPDASFDLVNARFIGFLTADSWAAFVRECFRVTRPGGTVRLTETEMGVSTSAALERMTGWFTHALHRAGQSFSPDGRLFCTTAVLGRLLRNAGFQDVEYKAYTFEGSTGTRYHSSYVNDWRFAGTMLQPFFLQTGVATKGELEETYEQMLQEMQEENFSVIHLIISAWGEKPVGTGQ